MVNSKFKVLLKTDSGMSAKSKLYNITGLSLVMARLGKWLSVFLVLLLLFSTALQLTVKAQSSISQTLGPVTIESEGGGGTYVTIFAPQDQSSIKSPIVVLFCVRAALLSYCGVGNIGYSVDGGSVYGVTDFMNKTVVREGFTDDTTIWANVTLPSLSEGNHNVTVYWGWYFDGGNNRGYHVLACETVEFKVDVSSPEITQLSIVNQTYDKQAIPLSFSVNEETSWIAYNLDSKGNVTIQGNTTITDLSLGSHTIGVFANDTAGNMGKTDTVTFEVRAEELPLAIVLCGIIAVIVVALGVSLFVYFKKYNKKEYALNMQYCTVQPSLKHPMKRGIRQNYGVFVFEP